jgi:NADPH:quinone reductase-like Zn-dependent oxidoreductase
MEPMRQGFHAVASGVGLIACQWAKALGAAVIGTVGNEEKANFTKAHGCDHPIIYTHEDFVERVKELTNGEKVPVVYGSIGKDSFFKSLDCIRPLGIMVSLPGEAWHVIGTLTGNFDEVVEDHGLSSFLGRPPVLPLPIRVANPCCFRHRDGRPDHALVKASTIARLRSAV